MYIHHSLCPHFTSTFTAQVGSRGSVRHAKMAVKYNSLIRWHTDTHTSPHTHTTKHSSQWRSNMQPHSTRNASSGRTAW